MRAGSDGCSGSGTGQSPLTVRAVFEGELPLAGMRFNVYRVADRSGGGTWSLEPRFKAYRSRLETQNGDGNAWAALARVLEKVALMDEACLPVASAETDEDGTGQSLTRCVPACIC